MSTSLPTDDRLRVIDTTVFSELVTGKSPHFEPVVAQVGYYAAQNRLILSESVIFEIERGLRHKGATAQLRRVRNVLLPMVDVVPVYREDWELAADLWALTRSSGRQLTDADLVLSAVTLRLDAVLVTTDNDFAAIPLLTFENWLTT